MYNSTIPNNGTINTGNKRRVINMNDMKKKDTVKEESILGWMREAMTMAETHPDNVVEFEYLDKELLRKLAATFTEMHETAVQLEKIYQENLDKANDLIGDLEHLIPLFAEAGDECTLKDLVGSNPVPPELQGVDPKEYTNMLLKVLEKRRRIKDWWNVFRVTRNNVYPIMKFMQGMNQRVYAPSKRRFEDTQTAGKIQAPQGVSNERTYAK